MTARTADASRLVVAILLVALAMPILAQDREPSSSQPGESHTSTQSAPTLASAQSPPVATPELPPTTDPREIVRRSVEIDHRTLEMARNYTCQNRQVINHLDKHGEVKNTEIKTLTSIFISAKNTRA